MFLICRGIRRGQLGMMTLWWGVPNIRSPPSFNAWPGMVYRKRVERNNCKQSIRWGESEFFNLVFVCVLLLPALSTHSFIFKGWTLVLVWYRSVLPEGLIAFATNFNDHFLYLVWVFLLIYTCLFQHVCPSNQRTTS